MKGKRLKIKNSDDVWENGWVVDAAGSNRLAQYELPDYHVLIKGHLKMTGDTEPKQAKAKK